jgi:hypothetical protein
MRFQQLKGDMFTIQGFPRAEGERKSTKKNKRKNGTQSECRFLGMRWNVT